MSENPFILSCENHIMGDLDHVSYYPGVKAWRESGSALARYWMGPDNPRLATKYDRPWSADTLIEDMDEAGIDVSTVLRESFLDVSGYSTAISTNGEVFKQAQKYPDRLLLEANVGPILRRGTKHAIWEMKYWHEEHGVNLFKVYAPEDGPLDHPDMWPYYEAAEELGVVLTVHTGIAYARPQASRFSSPLLLDQVCLDFPDLKIIAYHMGWPEHEALFGHCAKHPNLYMSISGIVGWFAISPYRGYHMIGQAIQQAGVEKIVFGLDWPAVDPVASTDFVRNLTMPQELIEKWGYSQITAEDRAKILGLTLADLIGVEPKKRI